MTRVIAIVAMLVFVLPACGEGSEKSVGSPSPSPVSSPTTPAIQTRAEKIRQALIDHGYEELATADDSYFDQAGEDLCDLAETVVSATGDLSLRAAGKAFVEGVNKGLGTTFTADDGAVMVELFLTVYCPDVLPA